MSSLHELHAAAVAERTAACKVALEVAKKGIFFGVDAVPALCESANILSAALTRAEGSRKVNETLWHALSAVFAQEEEKS